jgi:pimeloyl-ACP methyl ester carboxylesterase
MRPLELSLLISEISYLLWLAFGPGVAGPPLEWLPFLAAGVAICQIAFEGYRWHMIPAYGLLIGLLALYPWCFANDFRIRLTYMALICAVAGVLICASGLLAGILYPVFAFVPLTGRHRVGTFRMRLADATRVDPYASESAARRELMVQFWYPAEPMKRSRLARYRDGRRDDWRTSNLPLVKTRSYSNPPVLRSCGKLPILLFTGPNNRFQNTFETEELASHGYLVVALDHPYASDLVIFPDGRATRRRKGNIFLDFRSDESVEASTREVTADLAVRSADVEFVIECLQNWESRNPENRLAGHIDASRMGILGHSFGGAVAAEVCARNPSVQAGINMDGWLFGEAQRTGVPKPFFFMADCTPKPTSAAVSGAKGESRRTAERTLRGYEEMEHSLRLHGGYFVQATGVEHMNYSDYPLFSQVRARTGAGSADARRTHLMVNRLSLAFFNTYLLDGPEEILLSAAAQFPEAIFRTVARATSMAAPARTATVGTQ